jgi:hypothetical protein
MLVIKALVPDCFDNLASDQLADQRVHNKCATFLRNHNFTCQLACL